MPAVVDLTAEDEGEVSEQCHVDNSIIHPWWRLGGLQPQKAKLDCEGGVGTRIGRARIIEGGDSDVRGLSLSGFLFHNMLYFIFNL